MYVWNIEYESDVKREKERYDNSNAQDNKIDLYSGKEWWKMKDVDKSDVCTE